MTTSEELRTNHNDMAARAIAMDTEGQQLNIEMRAALPSDITALENQPTSVNQLKPEQLPAHLDKINSLITRTTQLKNEVYKVVRAEVGSDRIENETNSLQQNLDKKLETLNKAKAVVEAKMAEKASSEVVTTGEQPVAAVVSEPTPASPQSQRTEAVYPNEQNLLVQLGEQAQRDLSSTLEENAKFPEYLNFQKPESLQQLLTTIDAELTTLDEAEAKLSEIIAATNARLGLSSNDAPGLEKSLRNNMNEKILAKRSKLQSLRLSVTNVLATKLGEPTSAAGNVDEAVETGTNTSESALQAADETAFDEGHTGTAATAAEPKAASVETPVVPEPESHELKVAKAKQAVLQEQGWTEEALSNDRVAALVELLAQERVVKAENEAKMLAEMQMQTKAMLIFMEKTTAQMRELKTRLDASGIPDAGNPTPVKSPAPATRPPVIPAPAPAPVAFRTERPLQTPVPPQTPEPTSAAAEPIPATVEPPAPPAPLPPPEETALPFAPVETKPKPDEHAEKTADKHAKNEPTGRFKIFKKIGNWVKENGGEKPATAATRNETTLELSSEELRQEEKYAGVLNRMFMTYNPGFLTELKAVRRTNPADIQNQRRWDTLNHWISKLKDPNAQTTRFIDEEGRYENVDAGIIKLAGELNKPIPQVRADLIRFLES